MFHINYEEDYRRVELSRGQVEWDEHVGEVVEGVSEVATGGEDDSWGSESPGARWGGVRVLIGYVDIFDPFHHAWLEISGVGFEVPKGGCVEVLSCGYEYGR